MDTKKRKRLEHAGWRVGSAEGFLALTPDELAILEMREALGRRVRELRESRNLTQSALAAAMGSSQSRVAKVEAGHPGVSLELTIRALLSLGANRDDVGACIASTAA